MQKPFDVSTIDQSMEDGIAELAKNSGAARRTGTGNYTAPQPVAALTDTRQSTHGDFRTNARISQHLKAAVRGYEGWDHLDDVEKESIDMICLKLSRIVSGKSLERKHWEDVEGYAHLAVKECK